MTRPRSRAGFPPPVWIWLGVLPLVVGLILLWWMDGEDATDGAARGETPIVRDTNLGLAPEQEDAASRAASDDEPAAGTVDPVRAERSTLADALNRADRPPVEDVRLVSELLRHYLTQFDALPTGGNAEITAAISGKNQRGLAFLPPDHPAINPEGELVDRWGVPFFFHVIAHDHIDVRSAGADRTMFTDDDLTTSG